MPKRTSVLFAITTCAIAAIAAFVPTTGDQAGLASAPSQHLAAPSILHASVGSRDVSPGIEHRYDIAFAHATLAAPLSPQSFRVAVEGRWAAAVTSTSEHGIVYRAELRDARAIVTRGGHAGDDLRLATALATTYTFTTAPDGHLISLAFPHGLDPVARGVLATVAATSQIVGSGATEWEADESDALGNYRAAYRRRGVTTFDKAKLRYASAPGGDSASASVLASASEISLRADGWPAHIDGSETIRVGFAELGVDVESRFRMRHAGTVANVVTLPAGLETISIAALRASSAGDADADRALVDRASLADILAELAAASGDGRAEGYQFLRLAALFRLDADAARAGARQVIAGLPSGQAAAVIGALGEAGTREAQAALGDILGEAALGDDSRMHAAAALGISHTPTTATLERLVATASGDGDIAATATLAIGNAALHLRDSDPDRAAAEVDALLARLDRAGDDGERALCLRALGNTGDPRILRAVEATLAGGSAIVRVAAAEALRLVPGPRVDSLIVVALSDEVGTVRGAAVFAAGFRDLAGLGASLARAFKREPDVDVRRAIVELAGARIGELPVLRALVVYAAEHERDAELRGVARALL